jgi:hypothetical protein
MGLNFLFFFFMKKKEAAYGLFEGRMVPLAVCSFMNFSSSCCSVWDRCMVLLMRVGGAPGLSSIAWSQGHDGGSFPSCRCSKTSQ